MRLGLLLLSPLLLLLLWDCNNVGKTRGSFFRSAKRKAGNLEGLLVWRCESTLVLLWRVDVGGMSRCVAVAIELVVLSGE